MTEEEIKERIIKECAEVSGRIHEVIIEGVNTLIKEIGFENITAVPHAMSLMLLNAAVGSCDACHMKEQKVHEIVNDLYADLKKRVN